MKCWLPMLLAGCVFLTASTASARTWTAQNGDTLSAEFSGVKDGKVVLRTGSKRKYFPLSTFSLADRDYIVEQLIERKKRDLAELIAAANKERPGLKRTRPTARGPGRRFPLEPGRIPTREDIERLRERMKANAASEEATAQTFYGLPVPSPDLVIEAEPRAWTDVLGNTKTATFEGIVEPGHVMLKPELGSTGRFSLASFTAEDINYVDELLKKDATTPVFPADGFQPLTDEDRNRGYRTWTDRLGVQLNGKYVRKTGKDVVFKTGPDENEVTYPFVGLSTQDRARIEAEIKRKADEARRKREAAMASRGGGAPSGDTGGGAPRSPFGPRFSRPSTPQPPQPPTISIPKYKFHCDRCGKEWENSSRIDWCPDCRDTYEFHCDRCGHEWTRKNQMLDKCPKCSGELNGNGGAGGSGGGSGGFAGSDSSDSGSSFGFLRSAKAIIMLAVLALAAIGGIVKKAVG